MGAPSRWLRWIGKLPRGSSLALILLPVLLPLTGAPAAAQHPAPGEPEPRPLHRRLALADAVAIARVEQVDVGRIRLERVRPVVGDPGAHFEIKRRPSAAPDVAPGDRRVWLLRGARSPYLLVDRPDEIPSAAPPPEEERQARGLAALHRALAGGADGTPPALLLAGWLDGEGSALRREAVRSLADPSLPVDALEDGSFARLAALAVTAPDAALRRASARAAVRRDAGRRALLARLPGDDPVVLLVGLRAALEDAPAGAGGANAGTDADTNAEGADAAAAIDALLRALRHPDAAVRDAALRAAAPAARRRDVRAEIVRIAGDDAEPALRDLARRLMHATSDAPGRG